MKKIGLGLLILAFISAGILISCDEPVVENSDTFLEISRPTNNQTIGMSYELVGSVYHVEALSELKIVYLPVFGTITNEIDVSMPDSGLTVIREMLNFTTTGHHYIWAQARNISNELVITSTILVNVEN